MSSSTGSALDFLAFQPEAAQAAAQAARAARVDAAIDQARAAVDAATAQGTAAETRIVTSNDGRTTTITDGSGKRTVISVDDQGQTTIRQGDAPPATLAPGPWTGPIRELVEAVGRPREGFAVAEPPRFRDRDQLPDDIVPLTALIAGLIAAVIVLFPLARALARRLDRKPVAAPMPNDLGVRFDRIEQAIETMAVEVERVSEAQRYSARLLTERLPENAQRALIADHAR